MGLDKDPRFCFEHKGGEGIFPGIEKLKEQVVRKSNVLFFF